KILGKTITSADNVVPISLERIDNQGKVYVTYEDATGKNSAAIPLDKGAGLVDTYYPGASEAGKAIISGEPAKENKKGLFERLSGNVESYVYEMNGERFAIPKDQADEFLKDNPTAKRIK
ncbi:MAG: hypothetical protein GYA36_21910, partial [Veillonellaceae bacterium]|nr:hypothetical protein [Veillonellaceae bacterium]